MKNFDFSGKRALVRVDFNVPQNDDGTVRDNTRIASALPTVKQILEKGGSAILMSHLGRPKGKVDEKYSLRPIADELKKLLPGTEVLFAADVVGEDAKQKAASLKPGQVLLLENLRFHAEEEKGDEGFAKQLAALGNVYVNDAFGTAHRAHASTAVMAQFFPAENRMFGSLMEEEIKNIDKVLHGAQRPYVAIIGGAKVSDKVGIIENLLGRVDRLLIGGAMAYTFLKSRGGQVGKSKVEEDKLDLARELEEKAKKNKVQLLLPIDSKVAPEFSNDAETATEESAEISADKMGLDIGPRAQRDYAAAIADAKTILWNGPMGVFEFSNFEHGTKAVAEAVAEATEKNGAFSLIGGGDSVAAVNKFKLDQKISYISTGGGAMLEYLEGKQLPGIAAIGNKSQKQEKTST